MIVGLAPIACDNGQRAGAREIGQARASPTTLYMSANSTAQPNPDVKTFYDRLISRGKPPKSPVPPRSRKSSSSPTPSCEEIDSGSPDTLRIHITDPHPIATRLHRAFEDIAHTRILPIALASTGLPLKVMAVLRAMTKVSRMRARLVVNSSVRASTGNPARIPRQIRERQHDDRARGLGGRSVATLRAGSRRGSATRRPRSQPSAPRARRRAGNPKRLFCGVGAAGVTGPAGFSCAGLPTSSE